VVPTRSDLFTSILLVLDLEIIENMGIQEKVGTPVSFEVKPEADTAMTGGEFYGAKKEEPVEAKPIAASRPATHAGANIALIDSLSPYAPKWTIKARVTAKSDIKTWHKATTEGKLFSVNLLDESGEIKATGFNDQCDAFYDLFQEGAVYYISSPCRVQMAKKQFTNLKHDYEITFERDTVIEKAEDQSSVPQMMFNFCSLGELNGVEKDSTVDVIGVLKKVDDVTSINSKKDNRPFQKRELSIVDDTGFEIRVTIWGKTAVSFDAQPESIVAFKGTKVSDFGGRSLSLLSSGTMSVDPDIPDAHRLKGWYDSAGRSENFATHQNMASVAGATGRKDETMTIEQVKDDNLGMDSEAYYSIKATIGFVRQENFCYPACASAECNKKVTMNPDGTWQCDNCNIAHDKPNYRYILSINVADHTGHQWLTCFDAPAASIMGMSANELYELKENDEYKFGQTCASRTGTKFHFRCKAKTDNYGEVQR
jgi:replication factor A1